MLYESLSNLPKYGVVSDDIVNFINTLDIDTKTGRYDINENAYVNIEIYNTKSKETCFFESHQKYIDIQMVLTGKEKLEFYDAASLKVKTPYDFERDIMFYYDPIELVNSVVLSKGKFVMLYPHEAHKPQLRIDNISSTVKKAVVKIKV